jgi:tetratricopeptide (TPR) repeat protein
MAIVPAAFFWLVEMGRCFLGIGLPLCPADFSAVSICGIVSLPDGQPAPRMTVTISNQDGFNASTITNDQGGYCFEGLPASVFSVGVIPPRDSKYRAEPVRLDAAHYGPSYTVNIFMTNPLEDSLPKERTANAISAREAGQQIPKDARKALERAQKHKDNKKFDAALTELDKAIKIYPDYFQAFTEKGVVRIQSGHPEQALPEFEKAIQIVPEYAPALSGAGYCLLTLGKFDQAVALLDKAVRFDSTNAQSFLFLGIASLALSRWQGAQQALESALKIDPRGAASAHMYLGDALAGQHLYVAAAEELRTYLQLNPQAPNAERLRGKEAHWRELAKGTGKSSQH